MNSNEQILYDYLSQGTSPDSEYSIKIISFVEKDPQKVAEVITNVVHTLEGDSSSSQGLASCACHLINSLITLLEKEKGSYKGCIDPLMKIILHLDLKIRPMLIRDYLQDIDHGNFVKLIIERMNHEDLVRTIVSSIKANESADDTRALTLFLAPSPDKRRDLFGLFEKELQHLGISHDEFSHVLEDTLWRDLTLSEKAQILLKEGVLGISDPDEVASVFRELLNQGETKKVEIILNKVISALTHPLWKLRKKAIIVIGKSLDIISDTERLDSTYDVLIDLVCGRLSDEEIAVREAALRIVAFPGNKKALPYLEALLKKPSIFENEESHFFRLKIIESLGDIRCEEAISVLGKIITHKRYLFLPEQEDIRIAAIHALDHISSKQAYEALDIMKTKGLPVKLHKAIEEILAHREEE